MQKDEIENSVQDEDALRRVFVEMCITGEAKIERTETTFARRGESVMWNQRLELRMPLLGSADAQTALQASLANIRILIYEEITLPNTLNLTQSGANEYATLKCSLYL